MNRSLPALAAAPLALMIALAAGLAPAEAARLLSAKGSQPESYGRIILAFDKSVPVRAKLSGTILVLSYAERAAGGAERLATEMPAFVSTVRRDPDGSGMRLALQRPFRINVQEAGEQVFVDLLPESWAGLPPQLPPEIVADLARRAQRAEAALKAAAPAPVPKPLSLEVAHLPTLTRLSLRLPAELQPAIERSGPATRISLPGAWRLDVADTRGRTKPAIANLATDSDDKATSLVVTPAEGYVVTTERDEDSLTIDVSLKDSAKDSAKDSTKDPASKAGAAGTEPTAREEAARALASPVDAKGEAAAKSAREGQRAGALPAQPTSRAEAKPDAPAPRPARPAGDGMVFAFDRPVPAALFERADLATLVFETGGTIAEPDPGKTGLRMAGEPKRTGGVVTYQFTIPAGRLIDLLPIGDPEAPSGWELVAGEMLSPSETLVTTRLPGTAGRAALEVRVPDPG
ncbi:MAG TPA: hypothetical protein VGN94_05775, partial [Methylobacterium sp.]|nr:hypothetical protein [Methylobacterium sp.]